MKKEVLKQETVSDWGSMFSNEEVKKEVIKPQTAKPKTVLPVNPEELIEKLTLKPAVREPEEEKVSNKISRRPFPSAQVPKRQGKQVSLVTNQYWLTLKQDLSVYQYEIIISPDVMHEDYITQNIIRIINSNLIQLLGQYVLAGKTVFTTTDLDESLLIEAKFNQMDYLVKINHESKKYFSGKQLQSAKMEEHNVIQTLLNNIIKQGFRETKLR